MRRLRSGVLTASGPLICTCSARSQERREITESFDPGVAFHFIVCSVDVRTSWGVLCMHDAINTHGQTPRNERKRRLQTVYGAGERESVTGKPWTSTTAEPSVES